MNHAHVRMTTRRKRFLVAVVQAAMATALALILSSGFTPAAEPAFKVLAFYSTDVEPDHVKTANDALAFYKGLAAKDDFVLDTTTDWTKLNENDLKPYRLILWLNNFPQIPEQRTAFEKYMDDGGGWIGFHVAAYNDKDTHWPWFVQFLGGAVFYTNNWPVLPAKLTIDDRNDPVTKGLPATYQAPANEWYLWKPSPRLDKNVRVLVTLDPSNYPIGKKDIITEGDLPVVWTNTKYRMLYINMGHGPMVYGDRIQNKLFENAILWLGNKK
jgi:type 1 glutamine amidotransferase